MPPTAPAMSDQTKLAFPGKLCAGHQRESAHQDQAAEVHNGREQKRVRAPCAHSAPRKSLAPQTPTAVRL